MNIRVFFAFLILCIFPAFSIAHAEETSVDEPKEVDRFEVFKEKAKEVYGNIKEVSVEKGKKVWNTVVNSEDTSDWSRGQHADARIVLENTQTQNLERGLYGIEIALDRDWKIYWKNPGDAGYPPAFSWEGSENIENAEVLWPVPSRFSSGPLNSIGYFSSVIFPVYVDVKDKTKDITFNLNIDFMTCNKTCIPENLDINYTVKSGTEGHSTSTAMALMFSRAASPTETSDLFEIEDVYSINNPVTDKKDTLRVIVKNKSFIRKFRAPDLFVESKNDIAFGIPVVDYWDDDIAVLDVIADEASLPESGLEGVELDITFSDLGTGVSKKITVRHESSTKPRGQGMSLYIIIFAFLGGLILNVMPCVLPVISFKIMRLIEARGKTAQTIRQSFLATSLGIIFSFLTIAVAVIALKLAGATIGWGFQFQSSIFITFMIAVLVLFAASMFDILTIQLPPFIANKIAQIKAENETKNSFLEGAFATLLAMPCSAPFLGTAVGFALSRGIIEVLVIFTAVGIGMAFPFLVVAAMPFLALFMPKAGNWMNKLRYILGGILILTAVWLWSVLCAQIGSHAHIIAAIMLGILVLLLLMRFKKIAINKSQTLNIVAAAIVAAFLVSLWQPKTEISDKKLEVGQLQWQEFDEALIGKYITEGKSVFIDVTADWCITCKVNKFSVLNSQKFLKDIDTSKVELMRADYTTPNDEITRFIASFGKSGVPFNVVFGPRYPKGRVLPTMLRTSTIKRAICNSLTLKAEVPTAKRGEMLLKALKEAILIKRKRRQEANEIAIKEGKEPALEPDDIIVQDVKHIYSKVPPILKDDGEDDATDKDGSKSRTAEEKEMDELFEEY